jgi:polysaccharide biosynthesis transport protein
MSLESEMSFNDYASIIKRRLPYIVAFFLLLFAAAFAFALWLPPVYQSTATILIESQQVLSDQAKQNYATERFAALKQVVLSNYNLIKLAEKYQLYGLDKKPDLSRVDILTTTRANITVNLLKADTEQWGDKPTFAFQITCNHYDANDVTNELAKLFLNENDRASKEKVTETVDFFSKEAEKRKLTLEKIEDEITSYKKTHSDSLPENKEMQVASIDRLESDLRVIQREYSATQAELRSLEVSMESAKAGVGLNVPLEQSPRATELDNLKLELAKQSSIYSDNHPSIRALQRKIDRIEKNSAPTPVNASKPVSAQSLMVAKVQAQMDTAYARLNALKIEEKNVRAKSNQIEGRVIQSAQTEGVLVNLLRNYDSAKAAYAEIKVKQDNSKIAKNIEMENKGERFVMTEAPLLPEKPIKPNRLLIILIGLVAAIASAIGLAVLMEMLDKRVRGVDALASIMKMQPIATIPYILNAAELKRRKHNVAYTLTSISAATLFILLSVHSFVMPIDSLISKIAARF